MKRNHGLITFTVIFASITFTACQIPPSPDRFFSSERAVKTGLVDYGHHCLNDNYKEFIARNFDYIVSGDQQLDFAFFKSMNPKIVIFNYFDSYLLAPDQPEPSSELAYQHDMSDAENELDSAKRLGRFEYASFWYVMNPGGNEWQAYSLNRIKAVLNKGFDGVHIDNVFAHLMHEDHFGADQPMVIGQPDNYSEFSTVPAWYDAQQSHNSWKTYLSFLNQSIDKKVIFNGINDLAENFQPINHSFHPIDYLDVCDGSIQEGFVYNGHWADNPDDGFFGDEYWEAIVEILINITSNKLHGVISYGDANYWRGRIFSFASFLIGYDPEGMASFYYAPNEFTLTYLPEWNLDIGKPLESYPSVQGYKNPANNIFTRKFENALIMVNPYGSTTSMIPLDNNYYMVKKSGDVNIKTIDGEIKIAIGETNQLQFDSVSSVQLEGYSAVILIRDSNEGEIEFTESIDR